VLLLLAKSVAHAETAPTWVSALRSGSSATDEALAVRVDSDGNQYETGRFSSSASFGQKSLSSDGEADIFLAKYSSNGQLLWLLQAGGSGDDRGNDLALDRAGNVYVTGFFTSSGSFRSTSGPTKMVTGNGQTIFLAKYSPQGVLLWVQTGTIGFGIENNDGIGVAVEPSTGTAFVTGRSSGETSFSSSDGTKHTVPGPGTWHMFLVKYDSNGRFQWGEYNEASPNSIGNKVSVDATSNAYVAGWLEGRATFHSKDGHNLTVVGLSSPPVQDPADFPNDAFLIKYDGSGNAKWVNQIGGYKGDAIEIAASLNGKITITGLIGNINGTPAQSVTIATSQPGGTNVNLGGGHYTNPFNRDVFMATYNTAGALINASRFSGPKDDGGSGIVYDRDGNLYLGGVFEGTINIQGHVLTGSKPFSFFVAKFTAAGALVWVREADGAGTDSDFFQVNPRIAVTPKGAVFAAGGFENTALFDSFTLHSLGAEDIFLAELNCVGDCSNAATFQFTKLKVPAGYNVHDLDALSINDKGVLAATAYGNADRLLRSFLFDLSGTWPTLLTVPGSQGAVGHHVNNKGEVTGTASFHIFLPSRAFIRCGVNNILRVFYVPTQPTEGSAMNDNGLRVGSYYDKNGHGHGFTSNSWTHYATLDYPGAAETFVTGVNDSNQVVGYYYTDLTRTDAHGFFWDGGVFATIDDPTGTLGTELTGINQQGDMVGWYIDANQGHHGFVYHQGSFTPLDFPGATHSEANGINDLGQIVGRYVTGVSPSDPNYEKWSFIASR
jgi:hypothetical protein